MLIYSNHSNFSNRLKNTTRAYNLILMGPYGPLVRLIQVDALLLPSDAHRNAFYELLNVFLIDRRREVCRRSRGLNASAARDRGRTRKSSFMGFVCSDIWLALTISNGIFSTFESR